MPIQFAVSTRNARLDAIESDIGTAPHLKLRTGAAPSDCSQADSGSVVADITLPSDWMNAAGTPTAGAKTGLFSPAWTASAAGGTALHFRIYTSGGVCKMQGTVGLGSGDLSLDNNVITAGQAVTINTFTLTDGNA